MNEHVGFAATMHVRICALGSVYSQPLTIRLCWNSDEPLVVTLTTDPDSRYPATWALARDMLAMGMQEAVVPKYGDVSVLPHAPGFPKTMLIGLHPPPGPSAGIIIDRVDMSMFLERTFASVPLGQERVDVDAALQQLLGEAS